MAAADAKAAAVSATTADPGLASVKTYDVAVTVLQDYTNTYSFLYQLSGKNPLTAYSIGNLVKLTVNEPDWKFDLLIDIADLQ